MKNLFYKYPECEPLENKTYLCIIRVPDSVQLNERLIFLRSKFEAGKGFTATDLQTPEKHRYKVLAFADITAEELLIRAQI